MRGTDFYDCIDEERTLRPGVTWHDWRNVSLAQADGVGMELKVWARFNTGDTGLDPQHGAEVEVVLVRDANRLDVTDDVDREEIESILYREEFGDE